MYICIYIYRERERDRERESQGDRTGTVTAQQAQERLQTREDKGQLSTAQERLQLQSLLWLGLPLRSPIWLRLRLFGGNHLSNTTCLTQVFFKTCE